MLDPLARRSKPGPWNEDILESQMGVPSYGIWTAGGDW